MGLMAIYPLYSRYIVGWGVSNSLEAKDLIGVYQQKNGDAKHIFDEWFEYGKFNKEEFFKRNPIDVNDIKVNNEFELHEKWKEQSGLGATPTILVNGYKLPDNFKIEDLRFLSNIEI